MKKYPEPIVGAFVINHKGELLLIKTHKWSDRFCVPGGHIELGEKIEDALKREVLEETGVNITKLKFLCLWEFIAEKEFYKKKHMLFLNYQATAVEPIKVVLNEEAQDYVWVLPKDALKLPLEKYTKLTIEKYILR